MIFLIVSIQGWVNVNRPDTRSATGVARSSPKRAIQMLLEWIASFPSSLIISGLDPKLSASVCMLSSTEYLFLRKSHTCTGDVWQFGKFSSIFVWKISPVGIKKQTNKHIIGCKIVFQLLVDWEIHQVTCFLFDHGHYSCIKSITVPLYIPHNIEVCYSNYSNVYCLN